MAEEEEKEYFIIFTKFWLILYKTKMKISQSSYHSSKLERGYSTWKSTIEIIVYFNYQFQNIFIWFVWTTWKSWLKYSLLWISTLISFYLYEPLTLVGYYMIISVRSQILIAKPLLYMKTIFAQVFLGKYISWLIIFKNLFCQNS